MSELVDRAISGNDAQAFKDLRKLTASGIAIATGENGANAAAQADNAIFQKSVEYAVGKGEMSAEQAVDAMADRKASTFVKFIRWGIKAAVTKGCMLAGSFIGSIWGPEGAIVGRWAGAAVAKVLNKDLDPFIDKGIEKINQKAKSLYEKGKIILKSAASKLKNKILG